MDFMLKQDLDSLLEIENITIEELADKLDISKLTINNWLNNSDSISDVHIDEFYTYAYDRGVRFNRIKEQFYKEEVNKQDNVLLFHGAKNVINEPLSLTYSKTTNDFGSGFYCGENLAQSAMFVSGYNDSCLYILKFNPNGLKYKKIAVDRKWMLTIAYYRGRLNEYHNTKTVKNIVSSLKDIDYIIAPIADNRMYEIIDDFINGEITDVQCQHCLSATDLGMQYVFVSNKSLKQIQLLERCYLTDKEKLYYLNSRQEDMKVNMDKVKLARKQYRNQGEYIEDIVK